MFSGFETFKNLIHRTTGTLQSSARRRFERELRNCVAFNQLPSQRAFPRESWRQIRRCLTRATNTILITFQPRCWLSSPGC